MEQKAAKVASEIEKAVDGPGIRVEARIGGGGAVCVCPFRLLTGRSQRRVRIRFKDFLVGRCAPKIVGVLLSSPREGLSIGDRPNEDQGEKAG